MVNSAAVQELEAFFQKRVQSSNSVDVLTNSTLYTDLMRIMNRHLAPHTRATVPLIISEMDTNVVSQITPNLKEMTNSYYVANSAYLHPQWWIQNFHHFVQYFQYFDYSESCLLFLNEQITHMVIEDDHKVQSIAKYGSISFILAFAHSVATFTPIREVHVLRSLVHNINAFSSKQTLLKRTLSQRVHHLVVKSKSAPETPSSPRVAIIIAGQLRAMEKGLPKIVDLFDFPHVDYFLSTWDRPGTIKLDRARIPRIFESQAKAVAENMTDEELSELSQLMEAENLKNSKDILSCIRNLAPFIPSSNINVENDQHPTYLAMNNHQKMYHHNSFWVNKLGNDYFTSNFDYIVKLRPDLRLQCGAPLDLSCLSRSEDSVYTESPNWKFESWGFGAGDQVVYGKTSYMLNILSAGNMDSRSVRTRQLLMSSPALLGHSNIGLEMWLDGLRPEGMHFTHRGYLGNERISDLSVLSPHLKP